MYFSIKTNKGKLKEGEPAAQPPFLLSDYWILFSISSKETITVLESSSCRVTPSLRLIFVTTPVTPFTVTELFRPTTGCMF